MLSSNVAISSIEARIGIHGRGEEPAVDSGPWLVLRGELEEPVRGVRDVMFSLYPKDDPRIGPARAAGIGAVIRLKPQMDVVIPWSHREFDRLWALALSGQLGFAHLFFTKPHYGKARVITASFSTEREE